MSDWVLCLWLLLSNYSYCSNLSHLSCSLLLEDHLFPFLLHQIHVGIILSLRQGYSFHWRINMHLWLVKVYGICVIILFCTGKCHQVTTNLYRFFSNGWTDISSIALLSFLLCTAIWTHEWCMNSWVMLQLSVTPSTVAYLSCGLHIFYGLKVFKEMATWICGNAEMGGLVFPAFP